MVGVLRTKFLIPLPKLSFANITWPHANNLILEKSVNKQMSWSGIHEL